MTFRWVLLSGPKDVSGQSQEFPTQDEAESWMGEDYKRLLDEGHLAATLVGPEGELYTMKLTPD